jgi:WD40 repeat protein/serine/threonine protein kinase
MQPVTTKLSAYEPVDEAARRRFEVAWRSGIRPAIEDHLPPADDPRHLATLEELVHIDLELAWKSQKNREDAPAPRVEDYLQRFPLLNDPPLVLRLLREEYRVRQKHGDRPSAHEYRTRFPAIVASVDLIETLSPSDGLFLWLEANPQAEPIQVLDALRQDQEQRWLQGDRVPAEAYLNLLTGGGRAGVGDEHILELIYGEYLLRRELREIPDVDEYFRRFPPHAEKLRRVFELKNKLEEALRTRATVENGVNTRRLTGADRPGRGTAADSRPVIRGYEIQDELGRGGMGVVYKAREVNLNRVVALKLVQAQDADLRARFRIEAEAVAHVQHPNIVQIFEVGDAEDGRPYMALEFVAGGSLADRLRGSTLTPDAAAALVETLAGAVHFAHLRGILHRDLKPGNILLSGDRGEGTGERKSNGTADGPSLTPNPSSLSPPVPKITDFGLAKRLDEVDDGRTCTGAILGTPAYMAPEQAAGRNRDVGMTTDVHALGAILYECLTGQLPFRGATAMDTLELVRYAEPPSPRRVSRHIPLDLETICLKCLQKDQAKRYPSAEALADDLRRFLNREPILARRVGPLGRFSRWCRRNPALASTLTLSLVALFVVAGVGLFQVLQERQRFRMERDQAQTNLYRALLGEARAQMKARGTGWWWNAMDNIRDAAALKLVGRDPTQPRELAIECMGSEFPCLRMRGEWSGHSGSVNAIACRKDGELAASAGDDSTVRLWSVNEGKCIAVLKGHTQRVVGVTFSPRGRLASASWDGTMRLWSTDSPEAPPRTFDLKAGRLMAIEFSPDGEHLAIAGVDGKIRLVAAAALEAADPGAGLPAGTRTLVGHNGPITCMGFSQIGGLASGGADSTIRFWDVVGAKQLDSWPVDNLPTSLDFNQAPDFGLLAWGNEAGRNFEVRYLYHDSVVRLALPLGGGVTRVGRVRKWWLSASRDGMLRLWRQISNIRLEEIAVADPEFGPMMATAVLPNGNVLAGHLDGRISSWEFAEPPQRTWIDSKSHNSILFGDGTHVIDSQGVTDLSTDDEESRFHGYSPSPVHGLALRPTDRTFALGRGNGTLEVWDLAGRRELSRWKAHPRGITALASSPDGQRLASASVDGTVTFWSWDGKEARPALQSRIGALHAVAWSRDGAYLAVSGERGVVLWNLEAPEEPRRLSESSLRGGSVAFGAGLVAFRTAEGTIEVRSVKSGELKYRYPDQSATTVLRFSANGGKLAAGGAEGIVRLWDMADGQELLKLTGTKNPPACLAFSDDERYLLHGNSLFDLRTHIQVALFFGTTGMLNAALTPDGTLLFTARTGAVSSVTLSEVGEIRAKAAGAAKTPLAGPVRVDVTTAIVPGGHTDGIWGIAVSPNGQWIATASHDHTVKIWDAATLQLLRTLEGHGSLVWSVAFSPDSRTLASGSGDVRLWDVETGRLLHTFEGHERLVVGLDFHPRHPWLVSSAYDGSVRLWDVAKLQSLGKLHQFDRKANYDSRVHNVKFRPDGRWLASTADARVALWELGDVPPTPRPPDRFLEGHTSAVWALAFSSDGRTLASGAEQGVVILWNGETFERVVTLRAGQGQTRCVSFSRSGDRLAVASYYASTIVWDLARLRRSLADMGLDW